MGIAVNSIESKNVDVEVEEDDASTFNSQSQEKAVKWKRKLTSFVWRHFDLLPRAEGKKRRAKCLKCGMEYLAVSKHGMGNMKRHLETCLKSNCRDLDQMFIGQEGGAVVLSGGKFNQEKFRELIVTAIIIHDLPFSFVECVGVRSVFQYLHPQLQLVSRNTAKSDALKLYKKEESRTRSMLEAAPGRISFTSVAWTSLTSFRYVCLTTHFIDKNWCLKKRVLNFSFMPPLHNGVVALSKNSMVYFASGELRTKFLM